MKQKGTKNSISTIFRTGYGIVDLPSNYDPILEDLNRKIEDLTSELLVIQASLSQLRFGISDITSLRNVDERIQRLLVMFDYKDEMKNANLDRQNPLHVCPEIFKGTLHGYPLYKKGFVTQNCDLNKLKMSSLVTVVFSKSSKNLSKLVNQTVLKYPDIAIKTSKDSLTDIETPFVFVAQDLQSFDENINFIRMVS